MSHPVTFSVAIAALLALTLPPKLIGSIHAVKADNGRLAHDIARMLRDRGFSAAAAPHGILTLVVARRGECRLIAGPIAAAGLTRDAFVHAAAHYGSVGYLYRSAVPGAFPRLAPVIGEYGQLWAARFGIVVARTPVIAVGRRGNCGLSTLPWTQLRIWPAPINRP